MYCIYSLNVIYLFMIKIIVVLFLKHDNIVAV